MLACYPQPTLTRPGHFFYLNDAQETDIEYLTDPASQSNDQDLPPQLQYSNQSVKPNNPKTFKTGTPPDDVTTVHEYRLDWIPGKTMFFCDGVKQNTFTANVPSKAGAWILNVSALRPLHVQASATVDLLTLLPESNSISPLLIHGNRIGQMATLVSVLAHLLKTISSRFRNSPCSTTSRPVAIDAREWEGIGRKVKTSGNGMTQIEHAYTLHARHSSPHCMVCILFLLSHGG
jgi:hypothetical protein